MPDDAAQPDEISSLLHELGLDTGRLGLRKRKEISADYVRDITVEDLSLAVTLPGMPAPPLKELRVQHHAIAKMLASGKKPGEVSAVLGVGLSRISILQADPTFAELLAYYSEMVAQEFENATADMAKMLASLGADSISVLHERLLDKPEAFTPKDLSDIIRMTADRTGFGPTATVNTNVAHSLDDETLNRIRSGSPSAPSLGEEDRASLLRIAVRSTELPSEAEIVEAEFTSTEGAPVREGGDGDAPGEVAGGDLRGTVVDLQGVPQR